MGALIPPVHMTSTYAFETSAGREAVAAGELLRPLYGREESPTQSVLKARLLISPRHGGLGHAGRSAPCPALRASAAGQFGNRSAGRPQRS